MEKEEFRKKLAVTLQLADSKLKQKTLESIIKQVDAGNGTGDVTIPAGQAAFFVMEYVKTSAIAEMCESVGI